MGICETSKGIWHVFEKEKEHRDAMTALESMKKLEENMRRNEKLQRVDTINGYVLTTDPEKYDKYNKINKYKIKEI